MSDAPGRMRAQPMIGDGYGWHSTRAAEQTDDPVFRNLLLTLALQWRLAAREEAATQSEEWRAQRADAVEVG